MNWAEIPAISILSFRAPLDYIIFIMVVSCALFTLGPYSVFNKLAGESDTKGEIAGRVSISVITGIVTGTIAAVIFLSITSPGG